MTLLNEGLNKIRDLVDAGIAAGDWGTGTAVSLPTDTGLQTEYVGIDVVPTTTTGDKALSIISVMPSTSGGTATFTEHVARFSDGTELNRVVFSGVTKSASKEIHNITTLVFTNGSA
jgi:hypothetical protein